jgi:hypothetical protein
LRIPREVRSPNDIGGELRLDLTGSASIEKARFEAMGNVPCDFAFQIVVLASTEGNPEHAGFSISDVDPARFAE